MGLIGYERTDDENKILQTGGNNGYKRMDTDATNDPVDEELHLHEIQSKRSNKYVLGCAIFASLNSVLLGYDVGVMSGAILFMKEDLKLTEVQEEVLVGCLSIVSLFGSLAGGKASDAFGRKWTMAAAAVVFQAGAAVMTMASSFESLMMGRLLAGIGIGLGVMVAPVYIAEISPTTARGSLTSFPEIFINLGILLGYVSNYAFSNLSVHTGWRVMLAVGILPSVFIIFALIIIPESPRWLVLRDRVDCARSVLSKTIQNPAEVEQRLAEIQKAAESRSSGKPIWKEIFHPSPPLGRMLIAGIGIHCFQQVTGIDATVYYSPEILKSAGIKDKSKLLAATVGVGLSKTGFIVIAILLVDRMGRKPLLYVSTIGMTGCLLVLGLTLLALRGTPTGVVMAVVLICANVAFFSIGIGPICWVISSEIYPLRVRAQAAALGAVGNRVCSGLVAMTFLSLARLITVGASFLLFSAISALSVWFVYKCVPETKGKSLEEIHSLFEDATQCHTATLQLGDHVHLVYDHN